MTKTKRSNPGTDGILGSGAPNTAPNMTRITKHMTPFGECGFLYVVEFSDGTGKIGRSEAIPKRLQAHLQDGKKFGFSIAKWWVSPGHADCEATERTLKAAMVGSVAARTSEYFANCDFDAVVERARLIVAGKTFPPFTLSSVANLQKYASLPEWAALVKAMDDLAIAADEKADKLGLNPHSWSADMAMLAQVLPKSDSCAECGLEYAKHPKDAERTYLPIRETETPGLYAYRCRKRHTWTCSWGS